MLRINQMCKKSKLHTKSRTEKHASYPVRYFVPEDKIAWDIPFDSYQPTEFTAPVVLDKNTLWADPQDISAVTHDFTSFEGDVKFNSKGIPLNPIGRTGLKARGVLGKWGANFAVDGIVTTLNPSSNQLEVLTITRCDTGETALPGGMVDAGETAMETRNRELGEEVSVTPADLANHLYEKTLGSGYVDDPRNTDNAWMETTIIHTHLAYENASAMQVCAGDDASDFKWLPITPESLSSFYANHGSSLLLAVKEMLQSKSSPIDKTTTAELQFKLNL